MNLTAAIACAAYLMGAPSPAVDVTVILHGKLPAAWCASAGRPEGCGGVEWPEPATADRRASISIHLDYRAAWTLAGREHAACHVVQLGSGRPIHGPAAEAECERVAAAALAAPACP